MNVHQVSFFAFWGAVQGLEHDFDLHLTFRLICSRAARPQAWLQGYKQVESAAYQPPHHDAAVHSWHIQGPAGGGRPRRRNRWCSSCCCEELWGFWSLRYDCQGITADEAATTARSFPPPRTQIADLTFCYPINC